MSSRKNALHVGLAVASLGTLALCGINCGVAADAAGEQPEGATPTARADSPAGHARDATTQCVTIQRGSFGNVADAMIASSIDGAHNPDNVAGDGNFGANSVAVAGKVGNGERVAFFSWDLSGLPVNQGIVSATATLQASSYSQGGYGNTLSVYPVTGAWTESGLTWKQVTFGPGQYVAFAYVGGACTDPPNLSETLYNADGSVSQVLSTSGQIWGIGAGYGYLYTSSVGFGTFVSLNPESLGGSVTYTPQTGQATCAQLAALF